MGGWQFVHEGVLDLSRPGCRVVVYFDGLCEPVNPGGVAAYGFVIVVERVGGEEAGLTVEEGYGVAAEPGPGATNNVAEYTALIKALERALEMGLGECEVLVRGDSQLVIRQLRGSYGVHSPRILPLYRRAQELLSRFQRVRLEWVRREFNERADSLSRRAYREYLDSHPEAAEALSKYFATEKQRNLLRQLTGEEPPRYMSKREASRLISRLLLGRG